MKDSNVLGAGRRSREAHWLVASTAPIVDEGQTAPGSHINRADIDSPIDCEGRALGDSHETAADAINPISGEGQTVSDDQVEHANTGNPTGSEGPAVFVSHTTYANTSNLTADVGQCHDETQRPHAHICDSLRELHRQRQDLHRAEKSLTLQIKAKCRRLAGGDKTEAEKVYKSMLNGCQHDLAMFALTTTLPFINARSLLETERKQVEKQMTKEAKKLPVYPWVESVRGFGALGFAQVVGECGDLSNYATVSRMWKRLGLAVINGGRQRMVSGPDALDHGYNPSRRSVVWNIGDSLFRAGGPYADLCRERKEYEREKAAAEGLTVCPAAKIPAKDKDKYRSDGHVHNRAKRYMEKRLMRDLWRAWRDYSGDGHSVGEAQ